ncbi:MAG: RNA polymerase sigma factor [Planctomycetota bacterium]
MTTSPTVDALLEHGAFVRNLAAGLLADPGGADDLVQDTWISFLRRPPRVAGTTRSWLASVVLNRARSSRRQAVRRQAREAAVARDESTEPASASLERLELQQRVVAAVLDLQPHYRRVVLLVYYEGLSSAEVARRTGVPAGTVRAQLARGLAELRRRLDASAPGGRAAWSAALLPLVRPRRSVALGAKLVGVVAVGTGAWLVGALTAPFAVSPSDEVASGTASPAAAPPAPGPVGESARADARHALVLESPGRTPVVEAAADPDLTRLTVSELHDLALWTQHYLRRRMLTAEPNDVGVELAALRGLEPFGATRILRADAFEYTQNEPLGVRGGGAYYSFSSGSHVYGDGSDLSLANRALASGFAGDDRGWVMDLGDVALARVDAVPPVALDARARDAYLHLWAPATTRHGEFEPAYLQRAQALGLERSQPARVGATYLLRSVVERDHDVLVAFRSVAADATGHTLVWRILRTFDTFAEPRNSMPKPPPGHAAGWLVGKSVDQLRQVLDALRAVAEPQLLRVPDAVVAAHRTFLDASGTGTCRILNRGRFDALVRLRGGGAYYDFETRSHDYNARPQLGLDQGQLLSGFAGNDRGFLADLRGTPLEFADDPARQADAHDREVVAFLRGLRPERGQLGELEVRAEDVERARRLGCDTVRAVAGHTYLLRAVRGDQDLTVALQVLQCDADGATLIWRVVPSK